MKLTPTMGGAYSGSLGGLTASHNKGGQYFRRRSVPTNPNTLRQQAVRTSVGGLSQSWTNDLSEAERQAWRDYAQNTPVTDSLGQAMTLSGVNQFVRSNLLGYQTAIAAGSAPILLAAAPVVFNTGQPVVNVTEFSGVFTTPPGTVTVEADLGGPAPAVATAVLYIAPPQTAGTRYYKGPYQLAGVAAVLGAATTVTWTLAIASTWRSSTTPIAAWDTLLIPLRARLLYVDGRLSEVWMGLVAFEDATP